MQAPRQASGLFAIQGLPALATSIAVRSAELMPVRLGALGGVGFSNVRGAISPRIDFKRLVTLAYGLTARIALSAGPELEPELLFVTDGLSDGTSEDTDASGNSRGTTETLQVMDRLQLPVFLRVTPWAGPTIRPFGVAGPLVASRVREYMRLTGSTKQTIDRTVFKPTQFGAAIGAGVQPRLGTGRFEVQGRYDLGLSDLGRLFGPGPSHTRAFRILAGYEI